LRDMRKSKLYPEFCLRFQKKIEPPGARKGEEKEVLTAKKFCPQEKRINGGEKSECDVGKELQNTRQRVVGKELR